MVRHTLAVVVLATLAACGGGPGPVAPVVGAPVVTDAAVPPPAVDARQRRVLDAQANQLERIGRDLQDTHAEGYLLAADAVTQIHASPAWRSRKAKANAYEPVDAAHLREVAEHVKRLGLAYEQAALALRAADTDATHVADALDQLSAQLASTHHDWIDGLSADLHAEVLFDSALCRQPARPKHGDRDIDPVCTFIGALTGAESSAATLGRPARDAIDASVDAVQVAFDGQLDPHATAALLRAVGSPEEP